MVGRYLYSLIWLFVLGIAVNAVALSFPILLKSVVEGIAPGVKWENQFYLYALVAAAAVLGFAATVLRDWTVAKVSANFENEISSSVVDKLLTVPLSTLRRKPQGEWITVLQQVYDLKWAVGLAGSQAFFDLFLIFGYCGLLIFYDAPSAALYVVLLLVMGISMKMIGKILFRAIDNSFKERCVAENRLVESLRNSLQVRTFQLARWSTERWAVPFSRSVEDMRKADFLGSSLTSFFDMVRRVIPLLFFAWKLPEVNRGGMSLGTLLAVSSTITIGFDPMLRIISFSTFYQKAVRSIKSLKEVWADIPETDALIERKRTGELVRPVSVSFQDVNFGYTPETQVLHNLTLDIKPGEWIGLTGASGSGKTTLLSLLMRLYDISSGQLLLDGRKLKEIPLDKLRSWIGVVEQESHLFEGSVLENVAIGDSFADSDRVWECLEMVNATEFVRALTHSLQTQLGENDVSLSVGQKQRIALARALYWNPRLLLFDEPTSALDAVSEMEVQRSFHKIRKNRTIIVSAHRLHTLTLCDRIVVLEKGRITEYGSHAELVNKEGSYSQMWAIKREDRNEPVPAFL